MARKEIPIIPDNAVLSKAELQHALDIGETTLEELMQAGRVPVAYLSDRLPRFVYGQVVEQLRAMADDRLAKRKAS